MKTLFNTTAQGENLPNMPDADIIYYKHFIPPEKCQKLFNQLLAETPWKQDDIKVFNKIYAQPRLTALYGDNDKTYTYSGITMQPLPFTPIVLDLKEKIENISGLTFSTCLLNLYRNGRDSNGWHADDERELGQNPAIASISLGAVRTFKLRRKDDKKDVRKLDLDPGSLLLMTGTTQHYWQHQIPKTTRSVDERINLTFRYIP